jgi:hypothetical protein
MDEYIELSVDAVPPTCKKCERGVKYKKPHHPTCPESNFYKHNSHRFTLRTPPIAWVMANKKFKNNGRKLTPDKRGGQTNPFTTANERWVQMVLMVLMRKIQAHDNMVLIKKQTSLLT